EIASDLGYVTDISLKFDRQYQYGGRPRSFLSARCAAPAGFGGGPFAFARGRFKFANGQRLSTTLTRVCQVRQLRASRRRRTASWLLRRPFRLLPCPFRRPFRPVRCLLRPPFRLLRSPS